MGKSNNRTVSQRPDGQWANKLNSADRASSLHQNQKQANEAAADMLRKSGGGERTTQGIHGKFVSKDTIAPGHESSIKDREH